MNAKPKRVTIFAGHYGSGKTNIALNLALKLASDGKKVKIADLDIVNPYFRTADSKNELEKKGIELIAPHIANTNLDIPSLPPEAYSLFTDKRVKAVIDLGGDDRGAYALGRFVPYLEEEDDYEMCFVVNFYRPLTRTAEEAMEVMREIEEACKIKFTAIINNSNLGNLTGVETVTDTYAEMEKLTTLSGLKLLFTTVMNGIELDGALKMELQGKYYETKE